MLRFIEVMAGWFAAVGGVLYLAGHAAGTWRLNREHREGEPDA